MEYNPVANIFDAFVKSAITEWELGYPIATKLLGNIENKQILDFGCGSGILSNYLATKGAHVTGIDSSENMLLLAQKNYPHIATFTSQVDRIPASTFDAAIATFVFCTMQSKQEILTALKTIYQKLKIDSPLIILHSNWDKSNGADFVSFTLPYTKLASGTPISPILKSDTPMKIHDYFWPQDDYKNMLMESGFEVIEVAEPLQTGSKIEWKDETKTPPFYIIKAVKK